ncbi:hypothetical protein Tco_1111639 [Tanacetum coccineum]|uniref:Uncharacterized protein n=1 Tax=Tanacetum coccineum TaxID=301880 RepID=A0ABQ5IM82_9ASTR
MDDPNITMEEYNRLEEEKARKCGKVFNWETAKYGKIWYDEDIHDLISVETKFPAIAFNVEVLSEKTLSCEPTVSSLNDEIDFRISFDDSDDEDYTVIFDKNSFSYKIISTNDLKTDSENDNEKVNLPSLPSPEPTISCFDDLDFFKDFENEFPAIVYNDAQTSKSDLLTELILSPQHIDEFDLNDKTSLSEYDEEEQNVLYFNDLFPFNIIHPGDLKKEKDNDDNEIDIIQSSRVMKLHKGQLCFLKQVTIKTLKLSEQEVFVMNIKVNIVIWNYYVNGILFYLFVNLYVPLGVPFDPKRYYKDGVYTRMLRRPRAIRHVALPPRDQRHQYLRYEGLQYIDADIADFETRLARIYRREVHRVQVFDFGGLPDLMAKGLSVRMLMEHRDVQGVSLFTSRVWRRLFDIRGPLLGRARRRLSWRQFILALGLQTNEEMQTIGFGAYWADTSSYTLIRDPILRLCHRLIACSIVGRSQAPKKVTVTGLFYLRGMDVGSLPIIDMAELVRLKICIEIDNTWAWVAMGPERKPDAMAGAPRVAQDAPAIDEGVQAVSAPTTTANCYQDYAIEDGQIREGCT